MKRVLCAAAATAALALAPAARGFVRQVTSDGTPLAFKSGCEFITPDSVGTKDLPIDTVVAQISAAAADWQNAGASCSYFKFTVDPPVTGRVSALDGTNLVIWLKDRWGHTRNGEFMPYSASTPAQTTIIFVDDVKSQRNGAILDSDTELNDINFTFGVADGTAAACTGTNCVMDVQDVMAHEIGHMFGMDHTCYNGETSVHPLDNNGNPSPNCGTVQAEAPAITEATMYNFACCNETKKRSPEADDVAGMCNIYPLERDPKSCSRVSPTNSDGGGCSSALGGAAVPGGASLALLLLLVTARAYSRARKRSGCAAASCDRPRSSDEA
jgi:hypothetical protein